MDELEFLNLAEGSRDGNTVDFRAGSERRPPLHGVGERLCQEWWAGHAGIQWFQTLAGRQETGKPVSRGWVRGWD